MTTAAVLIYVLTSLVGIALFVRWEIRRQARRRFAETMARLTVEMEQFAARIGEAFVPAVQRATAALAALGEAIAKLPPVEYGGNPDRMTVGERQRDRGDYMRDDPDPFAHFDGSWMDRD